MKQFNLGVAVASIVFCMEVQAQQPEAQQAESRELDAVTVWATEIKASSVQMDQESMATKQADHISDLLRTVPGVDVGGAHSLNQRITIRSMDDKDLRITIDGANQNTYMYHHMGNLQINANILKSVDIEVGNNSVINGGLGGVVRFETKKAKELLRPGQQFGAHFQYTYADNASESYSATGYGQITDTVDFLAYYNLIERDNFEVGGGEIKDQNGDLLAGTDGTVRGLEGELDDALIKLGWDITSAQRLELGYESYQDEGDYSYRPDMGLATDLVIADRLDIPLLYPTEFTRETLTLNYDIEVGEHTLVKTALFKNISELWRDEAGLASWRPALAGEIEGEATNTGLNVLASSFLDAGVSHEFTYGVDIIQYETQYRATYDAADNKSSQEEATDSAIYVEDRIQLNHGVALIPGLRYNHYDIESAVVDDTFSKATAALAAEYEPVSTLLLRVSSTQLFKGPEIGEVFVGAGLDDDPNPGIKAETGYNHELSIAFQGKAFHADVFRSGITFFETDINDYIYDYASTATFSGKDNVGDMSIDGFEAYIGFEVDTLSVLWTYSRAKSELSAFDDYRDLDGARIDREQGNTRSLNVDYGIPVVDLSLHWDMVLVNNVNAGLDLDGATLDNAKDGYMVHNISARWTPRVNAGFSLTVGVDNLFDEYYASQSSRTGTSFHPLFQQLYLTDYEPGRNIKTTVAYQF
jgi:hemoglobin/transferrin/lactoferrin receptor protein